MISSVAYCAAIGSFYCIANRLSSPKAQIVIKQIKIGRLFTKLLLVFVPRELHCRFAYFKDVTYTKYFCSNAVFNHISELLCSYDVSFLKHLQLVINGDVESNPGPIYNNEKITVKEKGRPKGSTKKKGFKGIAHKKSNDQFETSEILHSMSSDTVVSNKPIGLKNEGVNVCFFNSIIQVLYSLPEIRSHVRSVTRTNRYIKEIKTLFDKIDNQIEPVQTSNFVKNLQLENYTFKDQYDAHECLIQILENVFQNDNSIFKFRVNESTICHGEGCTFANIQSEDHKDLQISVYDTHAPQSINALLEMQMKNQRGEEIQYTCEQCGAVDNATKSTTFDSEPDTLIIQLRLFVFNEHTLETEKIIPNLIIDDEVEIFSIYRLQGIISHEGKFANSGHYTSCVKINGKWYSINDTIVNEGKNKHMKPYLLIYKKQEQDINPPLSTSVENVDTLIQNDVIENKNYTKSETQESTYQGKKCPSCNELVNVDISKILFECTKCKKKSRISNYLSESTILIKEKDDKSMETFQNSITKAMSEEMLKDYFEIQAARISLAETKEKDRINVIKIGVKPKKRRKKFITDRKRLKNLRDNLDNEQKIETLRMPRSE